MKTRNMFDLLIERLWARVRKETALPWWSYYKYWMLRCTPPW